MFIYKQSTQDLFTPQLRKITNTITDIAGESKYIKTGGDIKEEESLGKSPRVCKRE
jgi:hypothetical protein